MVSMFFMEARPILAEMPNFVALKITEAEPAVRGDSATNIMKYAIVQSGAKVQVPLFIKEGDVIKIDTRTGRYIERVATG